MKNLILSACLLMYGCSNAGHNLSKAEALVLLKQNEVVPAYYFTDISTAVEQVARKPQMDTLEKLGLLVVNRHPTLYDVGRSLIKLTADGKKDSLPTTATDSTERRLKVADMQIDAVTEVNMVNKDGNTFADVWYVVKYANVTPFHILEKGDFNKPSSLVKRFTYAAGNWTLVEN